MGRSGDRLNEHKLPVDEGPGHSMFGAGTFEKTSKADRFNVCYPRCGALILVKDAEKPA